MLSRNDASFASNGWWRETRSFRRGGRWLQLSMPLFRGYHPSSISYRYIFCHTTVISSSLTTVFTLKWRNNIILITKQYTYRFVSILNQSTHPQVSISIQWLASAPATMLAYTTEGEGGRAAALCSAPYRHLLLALLYVMMLMLAVTVLAIKVT